MPYRLSSEEQGRLRAAVRAALRVPFIAGVESYVWEAVFHYVKGLPLPDPHTDKRKKLLFDAVDIRSGTGWSLKAIQKSPGSASPFELVIQRADILKKRAALGFPGLSLQSLPQTLGQAILAHWNKKIDADMERQGVKSPRVAILLKSSDHRRYAFLEQDLYRFSPDELSWSWTNQTRLGLQAQRADGTVALRWYPNQKQLFESFTLSEDSYRFEVDPHPLSPDDFLKAVSALQ